MEMIDLANNDANTVLNALEAGLKKASSDSERGQKFSLVIDGSTLSYVFAYEDNLGGDSTDLENRPKITPEKFLKWTSVLHPVWFITDTSNFRLVCPLESPHMVHATSLI